MYYVIGKNSCPWCIKVKELLEKKNTPYVYKNLDHLSVSKKEAWKNFIMNELNMSTVPVVFKMIGGFTELEEEIVND